MFYKVERLQQGIVGNEGLPGCGVQGKAPAWGYSRELAEQEADSRVQG